MSRQLFYFILIGTTATAVHYLFLLSLVETFHIDPLMANIIAYLIAFQVSYYGHRYRTFSQQYPHPDKSYSRFIIAGLIGLSLNETLFYYFSVQFHLNYTIAFIATSLIVIPIMFSAYKFWSFAKSRA